MSLIRFLLIACALTVGSSNVQGQTVGMRSKISEYFFNYNLPYGGTGRCKVEDVITNDSAQSVSVFLGEPFATQTIDRQLVERVYADVSRFIDPQYKDYKLIIYAKKVRIEDLVIGGCDDSMQRTWNEIHHHGKNWVTPVSRPINISAGLQDRHICLWASHGFYWSIPDKTWKWQRPKLFTTTEDLLSQTIVVPYLMPMLENSGAIVFSPRERDWQRNEVIVDNDLPIKDGKYLEANGRHLWAMGDSGFAHRKDIYLDKDNPFRDGSSRKVKAQGRKSQLSTAYWIPRITSAGKYAVYVSYTTLPTSVDDAMYIVRHRGIETAFRVNQQMGGGTWVYLGTFDFAEGEDDNNCVMLTNLSDCDGEVTADAVRFGGGMGNIARGDSVSVRVSGLPRFLEGARYSAQWAGMPYEVYATKNSQNDYAEDINARSKMETLIAAGSKYLPCDTMGLHVPIELSLALHTDAGFTHDGSNTGSLGIYTTDTAEGLLPSGLARLTSRDLCDIVLTQVDNDMRATYGQWTRRQMWDRNYSETREPQVPSMILEMFSHQNFFDMCLAHDPTFKFQLARSIYKGILRYIARMHGSKAVVQPLPVTAPSADIDVNDRSVRVSWQPVEDPLEPTASPHGYIIYHSEGDKGFDNGTYVHSTHATLDNLSTNILHRFRISAVNSGGESLPSQEVCAYISSNSHGKLLIVDNFDRLAGPKPLNNDSLQGFDMLADFGVPIERMPGYCGRQVYFSKSGMGREGNNGLGHSLTELQGTIIAGNSNDWSSKHAADIIAVTQQYSIASTTASALVKDAIDTRGYAMMDIICGLQKDDEYSLNRHKVLTRDMQAVIARYAKSGGNILISGAFIGSDMADEPSSNFTRSVLKYVYENTLSADSVSNLSGLNKNFEIFDKPNETSYFVQYMNCLAPVAPAFCPMVFAPKGEAAAVAYQGSDYRTMCFGFPLESIKEASVRRYIFAGILNFLLWAK
ncbi:MAG: hypothetical protein K6F94_05960 [Bacteroidaceae bacterium]|nr:hypothetical protein [Bacteroidaceae bacterium]